MPNGGMLILEAKKFATKQLSVLPTQVLEYSEVKAHFNLIAKM